MSNVVASVLYVRIIVRSSALEDLVLPTVLLSQALTPAIMASLTSERHEVQDQRREEHAALRSRPHHHLPGPGRAAARPQLRPAGGGRGRAH
ncbi:MAG: hypothetical protein AMJ77_06990 [Dehalococcoidia bacterium SM23_28_2]|nr:MAG: hypothetical protein AMJ77_06990 [Dehalococcoidia bacterium SM23_28_2]